MKKLLNPLWVLALNTLPMAILAVLFVGILNIVITELTEESIRLLNVFALAFGVLTMVNAGLSIVFSLRKKQLPLLYGAANVVLYIFLVYFYYQNANDIIPWSVPRWMLPDYYDMYVLSFCMPTMVHSLLIVVTKLTPDERKFKPWLNFLLAISIPAIWYVFGVLLQGYINLPYQAFLENMFIVLFIGSTVMFFLFLIRGIYILVKDKYSAWYEYRLVWRIPLGIAFPIAGLLLNNGHIMNELEGVFGNFNDIWFYIIAVANGIIFCLPTPDKQQYRLALFAVRSITFSYVLYFFFVFLPYLPFSIIAIILIGLGFLMLTPVMLFVVQLNDTVADIKYLTEKYSKSLIYGVFVAGLITLPTAVIITYKADRIVLDKMLTHVYKPDYTSVEKPDIKQKSVLRILENVSRHKPGFRFFDTARKSPYLSSLYQWIVLDNLTLSDDKINTFKRIFAGEPDMISGGGRGSWAWNDSVSISTINVKWEFDSLQQAYKSEIKLELQNLTQRQAEYTTEFELPEGVWISDYYLMIEDRKEKGILAEKKAATWVYQQITSARRDPGILYYLSGNKLAFKVFPFSAEQIRETAFEVIHKEPFTFVIDTDTVFVGDSTRIKALSNIITDEDKKVAYISSEAKKKLPKVTRTPYLHFIVDVSEAGIGNESEYIEQIKKAIQLSGLNEKDCRFTLSNAYNYTFDYKENWHEIVKNADYSGGFFLDLAMRKLLVQAYESLEMKYPVPVVISADFYESVIFKNFADLRFTYPESPLFYVLEEGKLIAHSLIDSPYNSLDFEYANTPIEVYAYPDADKPLHFLPADSSSNIVLLDPKSQFSAKNAESKNWISGLQQQGFWFRHLLHPEDTDTDWLEQVKFSFATHIMSPLTSFISVETEAQKAMLLKKQEETLQADKSFDLGENVNQMSEPRLWIMVVLILLAGSISWAYRYWFRRRPEQN